MPADRMVETDVLVIGAGFAGLFAAIKAREQGLDVTITDKVFVGRAGSTHYSEGDMIYYKPERGYIFSA
jgi:succinate dehydrogenase/fumarate reductase flavoprotein subunit